MSTADFGCCCAESGLTESHPVDEFGCPHPPLRQTVPPLMPRVPTVINDEGHATDLASPDRGHNPLTRVSCWARRPRSRRLCAEAPAYKFLESRVLSSFVFLDTTGIGAKQALGLYRSCVLRQLVPASRGPKCPGCRGSTGFTEGGLQYPRPAAR